MAIPKPRTDLNEETAEALRDLALRLCIPQIVRMLDENVLTAPERAQIAEQPVRRIPGIVANNRGWSLERAVIDLALETSLLDVGGHRRLRREIGDAVEMREAGPLPSWDPVAGKLYYCGAQVRTVSARGANIRLLLDSFAELGWPSRIDNPLSGGIDSQKLGETLATLNKGLLGLRFRGDGTAQGVTWEPRN